MDLNTVKDRRYHLQYTTTSTSCVNTALARVVTGISENSQDDCTDACVEMLKIYTLAVLFQSPPYVFTAQNRVCMHRPFLRR